jgi:hypothetical protein
MTALPLALLLALAPAAAAPAVPAPPAARRADPGAPHAEPTRADLQRALAALERSAVEVEGPGGGRGPGIAVGAGGEVLTSSDWVGPEGATVWHAGARLEARLVLADPGGGLAVVRVGPGAAAPPAVPVRLLEEVPPDSWLIAAPRFGGRPYPVRLRAAAAGALAPAPHFAVQQALPPGAPLFDASGRLVGLVVRSAGTRRRLALPLAPLARRLAEAR